MKVGGWVTVLQLQWKRFYCDEEEEDNKDEFMSIQTVFVSFELTFCDFYLRCIVASFDLIAAPEILNNKII